jgi:hypothetical protein
MRSSSREVHVWGSDFEQTCTLVKRRSHVNATKVECRRARESAHGLVAFVINLDGKLTVPGRGPFVLSIRP